MDSHRCVQHAGASVPNNRLEWPAEPGRSARALAFTGTASKGRQMNLYRFAFLSAIIIPAVGCDKQTQNIPAPLTPAPLTPEAAPVSPRYQIVFRLHLSADTFLLDTQKGRVWPMTKFTDLQGEPSAWMEIGVIDNSGEIGMKFIEFLRLNPPPRPTERKGKK